MEIYRSIRNGLISLVNTGIRGVLDYPRLFYGPNEVFYQSEKNKVAREKRREIVRCLEKEVRIEAKRRDAALREALRVAKLRLPDERLRNYSRVVGDFFKYGSAQIVLPAIIFSFLSMVVWAEIIYPRKGQDLPILERETYFFDVNDDGIKDKVLIESGEKKTLYLGDLLGGYKQVDLESNLEKKIDSEIEKLRVAK